MPRLGFACMYRHPHRSLSVKELETIERTFNPRSTTLRWVSGASREAARNKLLELVEHNLQAQLRLLDYVVQLPQALRMLRLSSDLLPLYSHPSVAHVYREADFQALMAERFAAIGAFARARQIRLSFHPGQYCVLGSDRPEVVENSLAEFEYHADMIRMMGYGQVFQDFKCNVHIAGRLGGAGIRTVWPRLSEVARNVITFENDEKTYGLDDCLALADLAPVVLDIHHCWIHEGDYIDPGDARVERVIESWRGVRPTMHYSQPPEHLQALGFGPDRKLVIGELLEQVNKRDLYAHSARMWNRWTNRYALQFLDRFDIMFESKDKNLATLDYFNDYLA
ncbi:UV-damage endonuclease [Pseudomonas sp. URIL14HWK12:I3]|uniref:UV DNA damage repair endonuclease UvsE n=1 Tax=Pseudomonas TaxID=286 RepID=UPI000DACD2A2|nr:MULTISPECIES: UV DNA damage repair endonuclease UvsE [unclassified Pseudomonas]PZW58572.1 UV-damage endonuclease [Pseudomonas sp. URIL14HWK12:I2]PZW59032.1 UV-damage endonuclease [Pseudomonas sp. URIL14HWK12:I3]